MLFEVEGGQDRALIPEISRPLQVHRPGVRPALAAGDHPIKAGQDLRQRPVVGEALMRAGQRIEMENAIRADGEAAKIDRPEQRLGAQEPHRGRGVEKERDALLGALLIFGRDADPHVREGPDVRASVVHEAVVYLGDRPADRIRPPLSSGFLVVLNAAKVLAHPIGALGEHLEAMVPRGRHDAEHPVDPLVRDRLQEQISHRAHEDRSRLAPAKRLRQRLLVQEEFDLVGVLGGEADWVAEAGLHALRVAVRTPGRLVDAEMPHPSGLAVAGADRRPSCVGPLYGASVTHPSGPSR